MSYVHNSAIAADALGSEKRLLSGCPTDWNSPQYMISEEKFNGVEGVPSLDLYNINQLKDVV